MNWRGSLTQTAVDEETTVTQPNQRKGARAQRSNDDRCALASLRLCVESWLRGYAVEVVKPLGYCRSGAIITLWTKEISIPRSRRPNARPIRAPGVVRAPSLRFAGFAGQRSEICRAGQVITTARNLPMLAITSCGSMTCFFVRIPAAGIVSRSRTLRPCSLSNPIHLL